MRLRILAVLVLVLVAGCAAGQDPTPTEMTPTVTASTDPTSPIATAASSPTATSTPSPIPSPTATPTPVPPDNPWKKDPIVIGIDSGADPDRNYTLPVVEAVDYWRVSGENHTDWFANFTVETDARSPDILIRFVNDIPECGISEGGIILGCARILAADSMPEDPEVVLINLGLTDQSTYRVVRHELGHVLGLNHGEGPASVMDNHTTVFDQVVRVHLELETSADHEIRYTENQLEYVFEYYSSGADGFLEEDVQFALVEEETAADVLIKVNEDGEESRASWEGDGFVIEINGIPTDNRGWHVGYWFGFYFGADSTDDLPPPFDEPESDPRSQWWH